MENTNNKIGFTITSGAYAPEIFKKVVLAYKKEQKERQDSKKQDSKKIDVFNTIKGKI